MSNDVPRAHGPAIAMTADIDEDYPVIGLDKDDADYPVIGLNKGGMNGNDTSLRWTDGETFLHAKLDIRLKAKAKIFLSLRLQMSVFDGLWTPELLDYSVWIPSKEGLLLFDITGNIMDVCYDQTETTFACAFGNNIISKAVSAADEFATALVNAAEELCEAGVDAVKTHLQSHSDDARSFICDMASTKVCPEIDQCPTSGDTAALSTQLGQLGECGTYYACRYAVDAVAGAGAGAAPCSAVSAFAWDVIIPPQGAAGTIQAAEDTTDKLWENKCDFAKVRAAQAAAVSYVSKQLKITGSGGTQVFKPVSVQLGVDPKSIPATTRRSAAFCQTLKVVQSAGGTKSLALVLCISDVCFLVCDMHGPSSCSFVHSLS